MPIYIYLLYYVCVCDLFICVFPKIWVFPPKWVVKIMENVFKMDDLRVPLFVETPICVCLWEKDQSIFSIPPLSGFTSSIPDPSVLGQLYSKARPHVIWRVFHIYILPAVRYHRPFGWVFFNGTLHPRKLTWNLKMNPWKRRFPLKTIITLWMFPEKVFKLQLPSGKLT